MSTTPFEENTGSTSNPNDGNMPKARIAEENMPVIHIPISTPIRQNIAWIKTWKDSDQGLIKCWENGRKLAQTNPSLAEQCKAGALPILNWKGGLNRALKKKEKFGALQYLAQWQGLRGEDLFINSSQELSVTCSATGMLVTFTPDLSKLGVEDQGDANA